MSTTLGFAAFDRSSPLRAHSFERREPGARDVQIEVLYCGVCHSDLHTVRSEWAGTVYPCVVGHEILGRVTKVGGEVRRFKAGDTASVGCMVDSCMSCASCKSGLQQYCENGDITFTYNSPDKKMPGKRTCGGYSKSIVVDEEFVFRVPANLDPRGAAPLLCAGITTYSPMRHWKVGPGKKVGIVGLGGLGHMGVKFSHAFGAHTVVFTSSPSKVADARRLGADEVIISSDPAQFKKHAGSFDFILDSVASSHDLDPYLTSLKRDGTLCLLGAPEKPHPMPNSQNLVHGRRSLAGSLIGGSKETQEMLDYCGTKNIVCDVEVISMQQINEAYERMLKSDVKYRFVIDMGTLRK